MIKSKYRSSLRPDSKPKEPPQKALLPQTVKLRGWFEPLFIGAIALSNRIVMAPMVRMRATREGQVATALMARYYAQRASFGLILGEASHISERSSLYPLSPGIFTAAQADG